MRAADARERTVLERQEHCPVGRLPLEEPQCERPPRRSRHCAIVVADHQQLGPVCVLPILAQNRVGVGAQLQEVLIAEIVQVVERGVPMEEHGITLQPLLRQGMKDLREAAVFADRLGQRSAHAEHYLSLRVAVTLVVDASHVPALPHLQQPQAVRRALADRGVLAGLVR